MKYISGSYGERYRFDAFCKTITRNEARTYLRDLRHQRKREVQLSALSQYEMNKFCVMDEYPSDSVVSMALDCDLHIRGELVTDASVSMPGQEQSILIPYCALGLTDDEIGRIAGISRNAVQRHRTRALNELQKDLQSEGVRH